MTCSARIACRDRRGKASKTCLVYALAVSLLIGGCATHQTAHFRKPGASLEAERTDWGLCGGNFYPSGIVRAEADATVLKCMREKGYLTHNEYYVEQYVEFVNRVRPESSAGKHEAGLSCGMLLTTTGFCQGRAYIPRSRLPGFIQCMSTRGFDEVLPHDGFALRILEHGQVLDGNFCILRTRKK